MATEDWQGISVLYVCPLRALLNNLEPRIDSYCQWLGRSTAVWHGDVSQAQRQRILRDRPDVVLTTPESIESMLVSTKVDTQVLFDGLRAVVVDEIHAFAGDDRGWHLLAVLERLSRIAGRELQRIGLSATVGNPHELLAWLQGSFGGRAKTMIGPDAVTAAAPDITVDYVGCIDNAATLIAGLHNGQKRLVFVDSRRQAEELGAALTDRGIETYLSHSSLSAAERRRSEAAFADARDTVIVATSTLELGVDVGDLDRVIQIGSTRTVSSFLQRLGRTGRRADTDRNCLFLCIDEDNVLLTAGMLQRWAAGWVEPIITPPHPRHIAAQQLMALCLQQYRISTTEWRQWWGDLPVFDDASIEIIEYLIAEGYFVRDGPFLLIGPEAERRFGRRYFSDLTAVFTAPPEFVVFAGRVEVGTVGTDILTEQVEGPRILLLGGRSWQVTHVDWERRRCFVETADGGGKAKWSGTSGGLSYEIARGIRDVLLGADPQGVAFTSRATTVLASLRESYGDNVAADRLVVRLPDDSPGRWWTWAGTAANRTLQASLPEIIDPRQRLDEKSIRLLPGVTVSEFTDALTAMQWHDPDVDENALRGLKFSAALPKELAIHTLGARLGDEPHARETAADKLSILRPDLGHLLSAPSRFRDEPEFRFGRRGSAVGRSGWCR
jgi:ATP-dependent Lhr-like helicase